MRNSLKKVATASINPREDESHYGRAAGIGAGVGAGATLGAFGVGLARAKPGARGNALSFMRSNKALFAGAPGVNGAIGAGIGLVGYGAYRGVKKLFGNNEDNSPRRATIV